MSARRMPSPPVVLPGRPPKEKTRTRGSASLVLSNRNCSLCGDGRGDWIRTSDLFVPNEARYQTAPRPDRAPEYDASGPRTQGGPRLFEPFMGEPPGAAFRGPPAALRSSLRVGLVTIVLFCSRSLSFRGCAGRPARSEARARAWGTDWSMTRAVSSRGEADLCHSSREGSAPPRSGMTPSTACAAASSTGAISSRLEWRYRRDAIESHRSRASAGRRPVGSRGRSACWSHGRRPRAVRCKSSRITNVWASCEWR